MQWEVYDPRWLVELAKAQYPDEPWLAEALAGCTMCHRESDKYIRFVDATSANEPGAAWQFEENRWLKDSKEGNLILDILKGHRVGGVEFYDRLFTAPQ
jgi:hypothetical protein